MIIDTSALVAIFLEETGFEVLLEKIRNAEIILLGTPLALEATIVLSWRLQRDARSPLRALLEKLHAELVDFSAVHYEAASTAFLRFGKGRHPAALNFGDCMSYALAKVSGLPLLYSGTDFSRTDIQSA